MKQIVATATAELRGSPQMTQPGDATWARAFMATSGVKLGDDGSPRQRSAIWHEAQQESLEIDRLQKLAIDKDPQVREVIAARRDCPLGVLIGLAHDRNTDVRVAAAGNPRAANAVLEHLLSDRETAVLTAIARNEATPVALLEKLAFHKKPDVRRVAGRRLDEVRGAQPSTPEAPQDAQMVVRMPPELRDRASQMGTFFPRVEGG